MREVIKVRWADEIQEYCTSSEAEDAITGRLECPPDEVWSELEDGTRMKELGCSWSVKLEEI